MPEPEYNLATQGWTEQMNGVGGKRHLKTSGDQTKISDVDTFVVYRSTENLSNCPSKREAEEPQNQLLLHAVLQALSIGHITYTSDTTKAERVAAVETWNEDKDCMCFVGSY
jgi:hypothetical protein